MPKVLPDGQDIYLLVHGSTLIMQTGQDRAGKFHSHVLTSALCENYMGDKPVSPAFKKSVLTQMQDLVAQQRACQQHSTTTLGIGNEIM